MAGHCPASGDQHGEVGWVIILSSAASLNWQNPEAMTDRAARLRAHRQNIQRYQSLLTTKLSEHELQFLQRRLAEEQMALTMLEFMSTSGGSSKRTDFSDAPH
jgi:hypothetical protein